ncbi:MAG TPA: hypothetical protein VH593_15015 [Ktedonobacteraceae bacterium]
MRGPITRVTLELPEEVWEAIGELTTQKGLSSRTALIVAILRKDHDLEQLLQEKKRGEKEQRGQTDC